MEAKKNNTLSIESARNALWDQGVLHWLLYPVQKELYNSYKDCNQKVVVWLSSRRLGKSTTLCTLALETCLQKPNALVKYCCPTQKMARDISREIIQRLIETCPKDLRPKYKTMEGAWVFSNGSRIQLTGLDAGRAENIRGGSADLAIIDEAGLVDQLEYIITSIILPTTSTTKGKIIMASTPPLSTDHPFITRYVARAKSENNLVTKTIYDNPNIAPDELARIIEENGGIQSIHFRREYLCDIIKDQERSIIPEFTKELRELIVKPLPKPAFYDIYVSMDVGMKDLTVVLFAWSDFVNRRLVIEDEFVTNGQQFNTSTLAAGIRAKEKEHFTNTVTHEQQLPFLRVSDNNLIVIKDLYDLHKLQFIPTRKDDAEAALNKVRLMIQSQQIIINPRCKTLISHLEGGIWNKAKTSFERSADTGHYDAIDSLKYLVRNYYPNKNPYPANMDPSKFILSNPSDTHFKVTPDSDSKIAETWKQILKLNK